MKAGKMQIPRAREARARDDSLAIALLFDGASAYAATPDLLILDSVKAAEDPLKAQGHKVTRIAVHLDGKWIEKLRRGKFDLCFNMCEGIDGIATLEPSVIGVMELFGIPYTGSSSYTTALCLRKHVVNTLLDKAGLPIPKFGVARRGEPLPDVGFPAICKPAAEDASLGIEQRSVVRNKKQLAERVNAMLESWDEILVQRYVNGREVNVGVLGNETLPVAEIDFGKMPADKWRIVSYQSKWIQGSDEDIGTVQRVPADLPAKMLKEIRRVALKAWEMVGGTGYGRVDMRIDNDGKPWILEVNANPDLDPDAGLAGMARAAGMKYSELIRDIAAHGRKRTFESYQEDGWELAQALSGINVGNKKEVLSLFAPRGAIPDEDVA